jgi:hypothetical protein
MPERWSISGWRAIADCSSLKSTGGSAPSYAFRAPFLFRRRSCRSQSPRCKTSATSADHRLVRLLLILAFLGDATLGEAAPAAQCTDSTARQDFAQRYVKFRKAEFQLDYQVAHNVNAIDAAIRQHLYSKYGLDCRPLSYVFFYYKHHCVIDSFEKDERLSQEYLGGDYGNRIPGDVRLMAVDVQQNADGWFETHQPGSYDPAPAQLTSYTEENRSEWAARQVVDTQKTGICLATIRFLLGDER